MPEGDTIHRLAATLAPLVGRRIRAFSAHDIADATARTLQGQCVTNVEARGKNLLIHFEDGRMLHVHLRMLGRLGFERPRSTFWAPRRGTPQLRIELDDGRVVTGSKIPVLRLIAAHAAPREPSLANLGPDLLREPATTDTDTSFDVDACVARLRELGARPIGEALLLQRVLAGIGNVYKSEVLFLERVHPRAATAQLPAETLRRLILTASTQLRRNVRPGRRRTRESLAGPRLWVYRRDGRACLRCHDGIIERILQGAAPGRSTYFCPRCQPSRPSSGACDSCTGPESS